MQFWFNPILKTYHWSVTGPALAESTPHGGPKPLPDDLRLSSNYNEEHTVMSRPLAYIFRDGGGDLVIFVDV